MRIYTEFIILHEDIVMPEVEQFCPFMWKKNDFDVDGDYYYDNIEGKWSNLKITFEEGSGLETQIWVNTYRENRLYEPATLEVDDLKRYIHYYKTGRYVDDDRMNINTLAITSLRFWTSYELYYKDFLQSTLFFLEYTKGFVVNLFDLDTKGFREEFLSD